MKVVTAKLHGYAHEVPVEPGVEYRIFCECSEVAKYMLLNVFCNEWLQHYTIDQCRELVAQQFNDGRQLYVKMMNGQLVGCVGLIDTLFGPQMANLFVFPHLRGQGHAKSILAYGVDRARAMRHTMVHCWAEDHMVAYYERHGFKEEKSRLHTILQAFGLI